MSFDLLPKNVIKGKTSDGKGFEAFEYSFETYAILQLGNLFITILVGGLFCAISSPIILIMLLIQFTGRFNIVYLAIPILSGYFIYDCANGWLFSLLLSLFIGGKGLVLLTCMNIACIVVVCFMTLFGSVIYNYIIKTASEVSERYLILFFIIGCVFILSWFIASCHVNVDWIGLSPILKE